MLSYVSLTSIAVALRIPYAGNIPLSFFGAEPERIAAEIIADIELARAVCASAQIRSTLARAVGFALRLRVQLEAQRSGVWAVSLSVYRTNWCGRTPADTLDDETRVVETLATGFGVVVHTEAGDISRVVSPAILLYV